MYHLQTNNGLVWVEADTLAAQSGIFQRATAAAVIFLISP